MVTKYENIVDVLLAAKSGKQVFYLDTCGAGHDGILVGSGFEEVTADVEEFCAPGPVPLDWEIGEADEIDLSDFVRGSEDIARFVEKELGEYRFVDADALCAHCVGILGQVAQDEVLEQSVRLFERQRLDEKYYDARRALKSAQQARGFEPNRFYEAEVQAQADLEEACAALKEKGWPIPMENW